MQSRGQKDAGVPRQILGERLLGLRADDRVELALLFVPLHEARALEWLGLGVVASFVGAVADPETIEADPPGERLSAERTDLHLVEVESRILLELLVDHVLQLEGAELQDVVRGDLFWRDLELLLWKKFQVHLGYLTAG